MANKIQRQTQKIFCGKSSNDSLAVFGSMITGNPVYTDKIEDLQSSQYEEGWESAVAANEAPFMEEMNGVQYGFSKQLAYIFQEGIPEYDAGTIYFIGSIVKILNTDNTPVLYYSLTDNNLDNNPTEDTTNWKEITFNNPTPEPASGTSLPLFTPVLQDHVLSYEESKGYALQGTYVYKESAPERYGYPDFYNKCIAEKNNSQAYTIYKDWTQPVATANITAVDGGNMVCSASATYSNAYEPFLVMDGVLSGNAWAAPDNTTSGWWQVKFPYKIKITGLTFYSSHNAKYSAKDCRFYTSSDKATVIGNAFQGSSAVYTATEVTGIPAEGVITDTIYLDITSSNSTSIGVGGLSITAEKILLTDLYKNSNGHIFYDITNKASVDEYFNTIGVAWMYGIDTANERVFLPRNNHFMQCATDTSKVGKSNEAGLPNITGTWQGTRNNEQQGLTQFSGAVSNGEFTTSSHYPKDSDASSTNTKKVFDASKSNSIYGNSDTVQPPSVSCALYIVVGNTEETQAITDVTEITTSENDTIPLFTGQYFDFTPNNPSWLKAGEQANSGGVYTSCYNTLVSCLTPANNIYNLKVIDTSAMVAGVDYSEYWKVNQDEMWFKTPTKSNALNKRIIVAKKEPTESDRSWYNLYSDGWCEQGGFNVLGVSAKMVPVALQIPYIDSNYSVLASNAGENATGYLVKVGAPELNTNTTVYLAAANADTGVTWRTAGYTNNIYDFSNSLYFKVANAVQNLELLNAGQVLEAVADINESKVGKNEYYIYETDWFDIVASGLYSFDLTGQKILEIDATKLSIQMLGKVKTAQNGYVVGDIIYPNYSNYVGNTAYQEIGSAIWLRNNVLNIRTGNGTTFNNGSTNDAKEGINKANVQVKIILKGWKI